MRCFLMRQGHIAAVEFLSAGTDEALIDQGRQMFSKHGQEGFDGFEVWDGVRRVYVFPEAPERRDRQQP